MSVVQIVGAGPGAEDLITVRGMHALEQADFVLYAGSLVNPALLAYCKETCVIKDSSSMNLEEQIEQMLFYAKQGKNVVRLHTGDPSLYGAINEQIRLLKHYSGSKQCLCRSSRTRHRTDFTGNKPKRCPHKNSRTHAHAGKRKSRHLCQNGCNACFFLEYRQN